jgi:hypothetical protein
MGGFGFLVLLEACVLLLDGVSNQLDAATLEVLTGGQPEVLEVGGLNLRVLNSSFDFRQACCCWTRRATTWTLPHWRC